MRERLATDFVKLSKVDLKEGYLSKPVLCQGDGLTTTMKSDPYGDKVSTLFLE